MSWVRITLGLASIAALALQLGCGSGSGDAALDTDPSSAGGGAGGGEGAGTETNDKDAWDNQAKCPEGPADDVPLPTLCPELEDETWCWTIVQDELVAFAVGSGSTATCSTPLERAVEARDMTEHDGIVYVCENKELLALDPVSGAVEAIGRSCWGLASFDGGILLNEGPDVRWYASDAELRDDATGVRYGESWGDYIETRQGMLYAYRDSSSDFERSCTEDGTLRADLPLLNFEEGVKGLSILGPARMFVLGEDGEVHQFEATTGSATGLRGSPPEGARGLVCGAL